MDRLPVPLLAVFPHTPTLLLPRLHLLPVYNTALQDARKTTTVYQWSNVYDTRLSSEGGCDPYGCTPALTRDQNWADTSRWSCSEQLDNSQCKITYRFEEPQDIVRLNIKFYKGDERVRTLKIRGSGGFEKTITSSGTSGGYEKFDVNTDETSWLSMEGQNLKSTEWISLTEVCNGLETSHCSTHTACTQCSAPQHCIDGCYWLIFFHCFT